MNSPPFLSILICTRDRAASLRRTLDSLVIAAGQMSHSWELLVVDNGSSDDTREVIASFADRLPIACVAENEAGLSNARNAGVRRASGEYLVWTDDDVVVDPGWLAAWAAGIEARPDCAVFGGRACPVYEEPAKQWVRENEQALRSLLAIRDTPAWTDVDVGRIPFGLNYAIRAAEQRAHPYDPELGVAPGRRRGGEEVAVMRAILREGGKGAWVWGATVHHIIPSARQSVAYVRQFYRANGYDYPVRGKRSGVAGRALGVAQAAAILAVASLRGGRPADDGTPSDVLSLVRASRAEGSLRRHLGLKPY